MARTAAQSNSSTDWLAGIAEPTRLALVRILARGDQTVTALTVATGVEMVNVSHHLSVMTEAGLVSFQKDGRFVIYSLLGAKAVGGGIELTHPAGLKLFVPMG